MITTFIKNYKFNWWRHSAIGVVRVSHGCPDSKTLALMGWLTLLKPTNLDNSTLRSQIWLLNRDKFIRKPFLEQHEPGVNKISVSFYNFKNISWVLLNKFLRGQWAITRLLYYHLQQYVCTKLILNFLFCGKRD